MNNFKVIFLFILFINIAHADSPGFKEVTDSRKFTFPEDHGSHPSYKTEWWYYTGHLKTAEDRTFGFQLTFFRVGLNPPAENFSAWHVQSIYLAHFAISDDQNKTFYHFEKNSRGAFKDAGASKDRLNVWNGSWETSMDNSLIKINASENNHSVNLNLKPVKPLVLQGDEGFSKKGDKEGQASYYYSFTRLEGDGNIVLNNKSYNIQASVWMDREFTSSQLARAKKGWDWFAIQLDSNEEIMVYQLRDEKGQSDKFSSGSFVNKEGDKIKLSSTDFNIKVLSRWESPETGIKYPSEWLIKVPDKSIKLHIVPSFNKQELITNKSTGVSYWEGRCNVFNENHKKIGNAYVELVGY